MTKPGVVTASHGFLKRDEHQQTADNYLAYHEAPLAARSGACKEMANDFYDLVTDFYEYGWGQCFHFAARTKEESFEESLRRHEYFLALHAMMGPGQRVLDVGSGVGGPARNLARFSGAHIVGLNNNRSQIERSTRYTHEAGLDDLVSFTLGDYHNVPFQPSSFDAAYAVEATVHSMDKQRVYGEVFRILRPGSTFALYEWCLTPRFDPKSPRHQQLKRDIEQGNSLPDIPAIHTVVDAMKQVGFINVEHADLAQDPRHPVPWYHALSTADVSLRSLTRTTLGRAFTHAMVFALETARIAPKGALKVSSFLNRTADALLEAGRLGIFTPMVFLKGTKPRSTTAS